ncbi:exosortase A [Tsuneonella amylolytica]|uniref:exosortase A n=1 Tax=Tsuneonella amylolytica TaxID=2338327 RepID=UPI000EA9946E|nr:exosortase A [Tsuneonella amylolytica]
MPPDLVIPAARSPSATAWPAALSRLAIAWAALFALTFAEWREMAHQWWDIDTYNHVLLVPAIIAWLVWLRRDDLARLSPQPWLPGLGWLGAGLALWTAGRALDINLVAQAGTVMAFQGATLATLGLRVALVAAFPLAYAAFLVPFGDELIPVLQQMTARMTIALTHLSGVPAQIDGLFIDTPAGKFVVAEECSGVKFLIAMVALTVLLAYTGFRSWRRRLALVVGAAIVSIVANGLRAWGTIFVAQYVGIERASGFDHIVYGWVFFAVVIATVLGVAWRFVEREPAEAGLSAAEADAHPLLRFAGPYVAAGVMLGGIVAVAIAFAVLAAVV